jgi:hypothetical protein
VNGNIIKWGVFSFWSFPSAWILRPNWELTNIYSIMHAGDFESWELTNIYSVSIVIQSIKEQATRQTNSTFLLLYTSIRMLYNWNHHRVI